MKFMAACEPAGPTRPVKTIGGRASASISAQCRGGKGHGSKYQYNCPETRRNGTPFFTRCKFRNSLVCAHDLLRMNQARQRSFHYPGTPMVSYFVRLPSLSESDFAFQAAHIRFYLFEIKPLTISRFPFEFWMLPFNLILIHRSPATIPSCVTCIKGAEMACLMCQVDKCWINYILIPIRCL